VATQHRSRRARASQVRQGYEAEGVAALAERDDDYSPLALVVDDEPLIRQLVSTVLRRRGWTVIEDADGSVALAVVGEGTVDLLVTDYEMPLISGLRLAEQMRELDDELPVLMVSGRPDVARKMRNLKGPRTAFVSKPFPVEELVASIGSIVD
jgi:Response regulator containing CheY-like receiver, AAA-type ATPase, and DNA-binding domains